MERYRLRINCMWGFGEGGAKKKRIERGGEGGRTGINKLYS